MKRKISNKEQGTQLAPSTSPPSTVFNTLKNHKIFEREAKVNIDQNINYVRNINVDQKINFDQNLIYDQKINFDKNIYIVIEISQI